jgi:ADP-heptose:LPS heptosyltransferase
MRADPPEPYTASWLAGNAAPGDGPGARGTSGSPSAMPAPADALVARGPAIRADDVVVLRALGLGDALTAVAALRGVRRRFPGRRIILAAPPATGGLLRDLGVVDGVLPLPGLVPLAAVPPGIVAVNLHGRGPASHRLLEAARPSRLIAFATDQARHTGPAWRADEHEVDRWCRLVRHAGGECSRADLRLRPRASADGDRAQRTGTGTVVIHPGAASASRRWPVDRWRRVAADLAAGGRRLLVTGSAAEAGLGRALAAGLAGVEDCTGRHTLTELSAVVRDADLVLSADTGIAHLATAWCVSSVVLFGPVPPARWGPAVDPDLHTVLWRGDPGADAWGDPHGQTLDPRLDLLAVDEVLQAAARQLPTSSSPEGSRHER